jgi:hypothetical protein
MENTFKVGDLVSYKNHPLGYVAGVSLVYTVTEVEPDGYVFIRLADRLHGREYRCAAWRLQKVG